MMALVVAALLFQEPTVEDRIDAFLKGDAAARKELEKLGAYAIRPLQKAREKGPEKIDALVLELKKAAAFPRTDKFDVEFGGRRAGGGPFSAQVLEMIGGSKLPFFLDSFDTARITLRINVSGRTVRELADDICKQTGLDYGYYHNAIVFAHPDRLWPPMPPPDKGEVSGATLDRAKRLVNQLNHELLETREAASRELVQLGRGLVPFLKEQLARDDPEIVARCRSLLQVLTPKSGAFGPATACRQALDDAGRLVLRRLIESKFSMRADNLTLRKIIEIVNESQPVVCVVPDEVATKKTSIDVKDMSAMDFLSLFTQSLDLDFIVQGAGVLIDTREAIQKATFKESK